MKSNLQQQVGEVLQNATSWNPTNLDTVLRFLGYNEDK
jgi:hypothetical protein